MVIHRGTYSHTFCGMQMDADWDEWDVIPDVFPVGVPSPRSFIPPTVKAAQIAPPPSIHITPRSPAVLQVPTALRQPGAPTGSTSSPGHGFTSCSQTVADVSIFPKQSFGIHRSAPYQLTDLQPGVNDRPIRQGYQPQSLQPLCSHPQSLSLAWNATLMEEDLPPKPVLLSGQFEQQGGQLPSFHRRGGSTSQQNKLLRLRKTSDSELLVSKFDELLQEWGSESDVFQALSQSQIPEAHRNRLLDAYAASTVFDICKQSNSFHARSARWVLICWNCRFLSWSIA